METIFDSKNEVPTFLFIDGSYFIFYRYFSLLTWWKNAKPDESLTEPYLNEDFVEKFKKTFNDNINKIKKSLKLDKNVNMFVGKDCPRETIWRMEIFKDYKTNRNNDNGFMGGPFFKMAYEEQLFEKSGAKKILNYRSLEADDCIAISVKYILKKYENCKIYVITSDKDYLQLVEPRVEIYDLKFKNICNQKSSTGNSNCDLFCKIVMGDVSDNIPSTINKCGPKTAIKCFENPEYFKERLTKENGFEKYERNRKLIDFNFIPLSLVTNFVESNICIHK